MRPHKKNAGSSVSRRIYSTRQIMEITEQRRLKSNAEVKKPQPQPQPEPETETQSPEIEKQLPSHRIIEKPVEASTDAEIPKSKSPSAVDLAAGFLVFILSSVFLFLLLPLKSSAIWMDTVVRKLDGWIVDGSYLVLKVLQGPCSIESGVLNTHSYKVSLNGDMLAFYSLVVLIVFASFFSFFQKKTWTKRIVILICLPLLVITANIFRVVMACGLAFNYGAVFVDRYFNGALAGLVFAVILMGLMVLEY